MGCGGRGRVKSSATNTIKTEGQGDKADLVPRTYVLIPPRTRNFTGLYGLDLGDFCVRTPLLLHMRCFKLRRLAGRVCAVILGIIHSIVPHPMHEVCIPSFPQAVVHTCMILPACRQLISIPIILSRSPVASLPQHKDLLKDGTLFETSSHYHRLDCTYSATCKPSACRPFLLQLR